MKQYRNEWKYCCSEGTLMILKARLSVLLDYDEHGGADKGYAVHSLYFDDLKNSCMKENDSGVSERFKYRIRFYDGDIPSLHLERKEKCSGRCFKTQCPLSLKEYEKIVGGKADEVFWETGDPVLKRFCMYCITKGFAPRAVIDYERCAFVEENLHVRVTLDKNISASGETAAFLTGNYIKVPIQEKHRHVLEVKFDSILPSYVKHAITQDTLIQTTFSKYYLGRLHLGVS